MGLLVAHEDAFYGCGVGGGGEDGAEAGEEGGLEFVGEGVSGDVGDLCGVGQ
jgi:hypothetical protein